ncbi:conserved hypothetical protein [Acidithiobacillus caldus SM-1]|uniref:Uncharacterized protein n=1 Tax=Acidithiobacillus caldus (strain SM-1) TaxID=990288 RepID=F9ZNU3_ACICS|nr:hypothetical protein [Acidithiobacillus caldus]AEK57923.1 conserved hypothetical protein [Acidithiobacillus caldus SM-1]
MPTRMMQRNNIVNGFVLVNDEATNKALAAAKEEVGEAAWKQGHSEEREKIARAKLKEQGVRYETELSGKLDKVDVAETQAKGTTFKKLRVTLEQDNGDKVILSADLNSEYAQRLLPKLESVEPGQKITIGGFATKVERDGREFTNHVATIKDEQGQEIKAKENHFEKAQEEVKKAQEPMIASGSGKNKMVMNKIAESAREKYFEGLAQNIAGRFPERERTSPPRLESHMQTQDGTWHSASLYVDQEGKPKGTVFVQNQEANIKEVYPVEYKERESKAGNPMLSASVTREDGSKLYVNIVPNENQHTGERYLSAMFAQKTPDMEKAQTIEGRGGSLKANETMLKQGEQNRTVQYVQDRFAVNPLENARGQDKAKEAQAVAMGR